MSFTLPFAVAAADFTHRRPSEDRPYLFGVD